VVASPTVTLSLTLTLRSLTATIDTVVASATVMASATLTLFSISNCVASATDTPSLTDMLRIVSTNGGVENSLFHVNPSTIKEAKLYEVNENELQI